MVVNIIMYYCNYHFFLEVILQVWDKHRNTYNSPSVLHLTDLMVTLSSIMRNFFIWAKTHLMGKRSNGQRIKPTFEFTKIAAKAANPKQEAMDHWL